MWRRCAAISPPFSRGVKATVRFLANTSGLSEYLPKALAAFLGQHPHISIDVEERESGEIAHAIATGAADLGLAAEHALPDTIERIPSAKTVSCWLPRARTNWPTAGRSIFARWSSATLSA